MAPLDLVSASAGKSKDSLDEVDLLLQVESVVSLFGPFIKYRTKSELQAENVAVVTINSPSVSPQSQCTRYIPRQRNIRNNKDSLYNQLIHSLCDRGLDWNNMDSSSIVTSADSFVQTLTEALWYIDGHHDEISERSTDIPLFFSQFQGYNRPKLSKHRKRKISNLDHSLLELHVNNLSTSLQCTYWDSSDVWMEFKTEVCSLMEALYGYYEHLQVKRKSSLQNHRRETPLRSISENMKPYVLPVTSDYSSQLEALAQDISHEMEYSFICVNDYTPDEPVKRFRYIESLKCSLNVPCLLLCYSPGSNIGNQYYLWKVNEGDDVLTNSQQVIEAIKMNLPVYHTRAMRKVLFKKYGRLCPSVKPSALRYLYHDLTGDNSAASNLTEAEVDKRMHLFMDMEDPDVIPDLRHLNNSGTGTTKYDLFWNACDSFLNENTATDARRHDTITHMARAISLRDLRNQVIKLLPPDAPIPSLEWIRLQFWPKNKSIKSLQNTGRFQVKYMVQQRQLRHSHIDSHYAACVFRYIREYAIICRDFAILSA